MLNRFFFIFFFHLLLHTNSTTMAPNSKNKAATAAPAVDADGKLSFNTSSADFKRLMNLMLEPGFFTQYTGPMKFFDHPSNIFWSRTYSHGNFPNGYNTAKRKAQEIQAGITVAPAEEDEPTGNINDMFASVPSAGNIVVSKKRAIIPVDKTLVKERIKLQTIVFIELAQDEEDSMPFTISSVFKGASQTYSLALTITPSAGVVPHPKQNEELDLSHFVATVDDGPNGECLCIYKECQSPITFEPKWKKATFQQREGYSNKEDWNRAFMSFENMSFENTVTPYQRNDGNPLYGVAQYVLPFKCLKTIQEDDLFLMYNPDTGAFSFTILLWHVDQSGRNAVRMKKSFNIVKTE